MRLFVYGTLKKNFHNTHYIEGASFIGKAITVPDYRLVQLHSTECPVSFCPGAQEGGQSHIAGAVYENIPDHITAALDAMGQTV